MQKLNSAPNAQQQMLDGWELDKELDGVRTEGAAAYYAAHSLGTNPYMQNSLQWDAWRLGWKRAENKG